MKIIVILIGIIITTVINYVLFVPSSAVNLMFDVFISHSNTFILLADLLLSNLIFWGIMSVLLRYPPQKNN
jgi:hypothetical protein